MTVADAESWIARYNSWAEAWNRHERDRNLPIGPDWPEASQMFGGLPDSVLAFTPRDAEQQRVPGRGGGYWWFQPRGFIRLRKWRVWRKFSACRSEDADPANIVWAGWPGPHWR
jgi:hypothetical protein